MHADSIKIFTQLGAPRYAVNPFSILRVPRRTRRLLVCFTSRYAAPVILPLRVPRRLFVCLISCSVRVAREKVLLPSVCRGGGFYSFLCFVFKFCHQRSCVCVSSFTGGDPKLRGVTLNELKSRRRVLLRVIKYRGCRILI